MLAPPTPNHACTTHTTLISPTSHHSLNTALAPPSPHSPCARHTTLTLRSLRPYSAHSPFTKFSHFPFSQTRAALHQTHHHPANSNKHHYCIISTATNITLKQHWFKSCDFITLDEIFFFVLWRGRVDTDSIRMRLASRPVCNWRAANQLKATELYRNLRKWH